MSDAVAQRIAVKHFAATEISDARARPAVCVASIIHPGVNVRFPGLEAFIRESKSPTDDAPPRP